MVYAFTHVFMIYAFYAYLRMFHLHINHSSLNYFFLADSESSTSDSEIGCGDFDAGGGGGASLSNQLQDSIHDSPTNDEHRADDDAPHDDPGSSDDDCGVDPGCEGRFHTMSSHLSKLDSLTARGCADKFFKVHSARWAPAMPRHGDFLHSARAGGVDARETRKRKASCITRSAAESHAFCTSSNLSQNRSDAHLDSFSNVSVLVPACCVLFFIYLALKLAAQSYNGNFVAARV
jgi:hypothetical protein